MKPSMAKAVQEGWRALRRPSRSAWRKRAIGVNRHLAGEHDLVETPTFDLGQGGTHPAQEVLVGTRGGEAELVGGRSRLTFGGRCDGRQTPTGERIEQLGDTLGRTDDDGDGP